MKKKNPLLAFPISASLIITLLGICLILWPNEVLSLFPPLIGAILSIVGGITILHAIITFKEAPSPWFKLMQGIINLAVGLVFIFNNNVSLAFLTILFGVYILISAATQLLYAIQGLFAKKRWIGDLLESIFQFFLGALILFGTFSGHALWARLLGLQFAITGASSLFWLLRLKEVPPDAEETLPENTDSQ